MCRWSGSARARPARPLGAALALASLLSLAAAGPLGPLPNVTRSDLDLKEGSCALGDVVYAAGEEVPGAGPCERCACARGAVSCARARCDPRPGCKALHRPDHCCPIYQCECEQEGRVYGNGEKLVDPLDPCRVCYCQGGEVVCRRIACFVRDDCRPRTVPGRCCPEYDNCPLRGVTTIPGVAPSVSTVDDAGSSPAPPPPPPPAPKENVKQEITIKEITPVSEIPVITEVKIKEILPSPGVEVAEYSSSKSPLIVREATSERTLVRDNTYTKTEAPVVVDGHPSWSSVLIPSPPSEASNTKASESNRETKITNDAPPSKISLSTQDSINSEIYPSILTSIPTMGVPSIVPVVVPAVSTKAPIIEEEDTSLLDHNPFPPLPDDLSVVRNHEDEIVQEQNVDGESVPIREDAVTTASAAPSTEAVTVGDEVTTTSKNIPQTTLLPTTRDGGSETAVDLSTFGTSTPANLDGMTSTVATSSQESPMLNLRSAIPTEILNVPSFVPEEITGELDDTELMNATEESTQILTSTTTESFINSEEKYTEKQETPTETKILSTSTVAVTDSETTTDKTFETSVYVSSSQSTQGPTTSPISKSNTATEVTSQTELSSLPIETSDQNPHELSENIAKEKTASSTADPVTIELTTSKVSSPIESEVITVSRAAPSTTDNRSFENVETTEFILTSFGSAESATDAVELIKISADPGKSAAFIEPTERKKSNVLTDLINLVGDVASIGEHTDGPDLAPRTISDSEELIPVNVGYKSKNNNRNVNSITEIPAKSKSQAPLSKQKIIEIEGDDTDSAITDSPPPNDRVEPTTRRPVIDHVSDDMPENRTEKKDIEIITKSYVPTINRRPTKVVMRKSDEKPMSDDGTTEGGTPGRGEAGSGSAEVDTESGVTLSAETSAAAQ